MPMQLPPVNTQGVYDIAGNAMAGGLGSMYAIQAEKQQAALEGIRQKLDQNTLDQTMLDNPNKALKRTLDASDMGTQQRQFDSGMRDRMAQAENEAQIDVSGAKGAAARIGPTYDERVNAAIQASGKWQAWQKDHPGADLSEASQKYWKEEVEGELKKAHMTMDGQGPTPNNQRNLLWHATHGQDTLAQRRALAPVEATNAMHVQVGAANNATSIAVAELRESVQRGTTDQHMGAALEAYLKGSNNPRVIAMAEGYLAGKAAGAMRAIGQETGVGGTNIDIMVAQRMLEAAKTPQEKENAQAAMDKAMQRKVEAQKSAATIPSPAAQAPQQPQPKASLGPAVDKQGKPYPDGQTGTIGGKKVIVKGGQFVEF